MTRHGFDLAPHRTQWARELDLTWFDYILCFEDEMIAALTGLGASRDKIHVIEQSIHDPRYEDLGAHEVCAGALSQVAKRIAEKLTT